MKEKKDSNKKKKRILFPLIMILYICIWLVAILFVDDWVWDKAWAYQKNYDLAKANSMPEVFMDKLIKEIDEKKLVEWMDMGGGYSVSEYSKPDDYERYFKEVIGSSEIVYEETDDKNIYDIMVKGNIIAKVKISSDNVYDEYNFTGWKLIDADVISYMYDTLSKTIVADKKYTVYINDTELTDDCLLKENTTVMGEYMSPITGEEYGTNIYKVDGFLVEPEIYAVDKNGNKIENTSDEIDMAEYLDTNPPKLDDAKKKRITDTFHVYFEHMNKLKKYEDMKPYLVAGTDVYDLILSAQKSLEWVTPVKKIIFEEEIIEDYAEYGDSYFSCKVYYNVLKDYEYTTKNEYFNATVLFKKVGNQWYIDMFMLNQ